MSDAKTANDHTQAMGALREELDKMLAAEFVAVVDGTATKLEARSDAIAKISRARATLAQLGPELQQAFAVSRR